jgi:multidrug efflux pump subunit AcrA (membrane-fusion protein)
MRVSFLPGQGIILKILIGIFIVSLCLACSKTESAGEPRRGNSNANAANENSPVTITVDKSVGREIPAFIQATGSLIADETSDIAPKAAGKIVDVSANVGQFVQQGSVIARIDDKDARLRLAEARASVRLKRDLVFRQTELLTLRQFPKSAPQMLIMNKPPPN